MAGLTNKLSAFAAQQSNIDSGYGDGNGSGSGSGPGYGFGSGPGYGFGFGNGSGNGSSNGNGSGNGSGNGYGYGNGSGSGNGTDCSHCDGSGFSSGSGFGSGCGYDVKNYNGNPVYDIDDIDTVLTSVRGNVAKGVILRSDLTTEPCYVVKQGNTFAHGKTLRDAMSALREKLFEDMPEEECIKAFIAEHKPGVKYPCRDLYEWHHRLTGSCEMGRKAFAAEHGIDIDKDLMTVEEFIWLTRIAYGGDVIRKLEEAWVEK